VSILLKQKHGPDYTVQHKVIKKCLIKYFGEKISFVYPNQKNVSQLFHSSNITNTIDYSYNRDIIVECADVLKDSLKEVSFDLNDRFCDENDLRSAWQNVDIPKPFLTFFSRLFNVKENDICNYQTYANQNCQSNVPIPSHFDRNSYVTAAFDNFDHIENSISGLNSTHDTVAVIFQDYNADFDCRKPKVSTTKLHCNARAFTTKLKCQEVLNYTKLSNTVTLPADFAYHNNHQSFSIEQLENDLQKNDFIWYLSRMNISSDDQEIGIRNTNQHFPTWSSFNSAILKDCRPKQIVGFLPILPAPVTEFSTVYTSLCNFKDILNQLNQKQLAVVCDEGVYKLARHITLTNNKEFENIIVLLGNFHMIKVVLSCIGKYLKHSGAETIFIEASLFGVSVTDQVLSGTHYARSVKGFNYLAESLRRLQIKEFFTSERKIKYENLLVSIVLLKESFQEGNLDECSFVVNNFQENCSELLDDFHTFVLSRCEESELFRNAGVIGITKKKESVTAWNLTYHELAAISDVLKTITLSNEENVELDIHHEFTEQTAAKSEDAITSILNFLEDRNINPFTSGSQKLQNLITGELVHPDSTKEILNIFITGTELYDKFKKERIIDKAKPLSALIPRCNLPSFKTIPVTEKSNTEKKKNKKNGGIHRIFALAAERKYPIDKLLTYDLTYDNKLFDDDGMMKKENNKSSLVRELEKVLKNDEYSCTKTENSTCVIIDVMLVMRKIGWKGKNTFVDLAISFCQYVKSKVDVNSTTRIDFIFDSYFPNSLKSSERLRRRQPNCITYSDINEKTALPKEESKFWGSSENKMLLQSFLRQYVENYNYIFEGIEIIFSTTNTEPSSCINSDKDDSFWQSLQRNDVEEADEKIMLHINHAVMNGFRNIYVISSDTDVIILALYYWTIFKTNGLQALWFQAGSSNTIRDIPIHTLACVHGEKLCSVLPAVHHLTGSDYTSKVGTKSSALQGDPEKYLLGFGQDDSEKNFEKYLQAAEQYLVKVYKKNSNCNTFNELRVWSYHHATCDSTENLPPTSATMRLHILRAFYIVNLQTKCLLEKNSPLNVLAFGFKKENDLLIPEIVTILLPPINDLVPSCNCKVCSRKTCCCVAAEIECCSFCFCHRDKTCQNKYNITSIDTLEQET
ncbi:hypothetical protein TSAR_010977, partial [Trichomalopsis sarcophagae]